MADANNMDADSTTGEALQATLTRKFVVVLAYFVGLAVPLAVFVASSSWETEIEGLYRFIEPQTIESGFAANSSGEQIDPGVAAWETKSRQFRKSAIVIASTLFTLLYFSFWWSWNSKGAKVINHYFLRIIVPWFVAFYPLWFAIRWWLRTQG